MLLDITHQTHYDYSPEVEVSCHLAHLRPLDGPCQHLLSHSLEVIPAAEEPVERIDQFGNSVQQWAIYTPHAELRVTARSRVQTYSSAAGHSRLSWQDAIRLFEYHAGQAAHEMAVFTYTSRHVPHSPILRDWALATFQPDMPLLDAAIALMQRIHREFVYDSQSTHIGTPTLTAFAQQRGVCQDFAHILLGALRSLGLAARYISGYLMTVPPPGMEKLVGSDASHAWVSVFLPDAAQSGATGWYDLDPTNNRHGWNSPGEDYVHLATGRDYADVAPLRGVLQGGGGHSVSVAVTVAQARPE